MYRSQGATQFAIGAILAVLALSIFAGCASGKYGQRSDPSGAVVDGHAGSTLDTNYNGDTKMTAGLPGPIANVDMSEEGLSGRGVAGDGARISESGVVAYNANSAIGFDVLDAKFRDGPFESLRIENYGADKDALYAAYTAQTDLYKDTLREMSADQRDVAIERLKQLGNIPEAVINALEVWSTMGASAVLPDVVAPPPPNVEPSDPDDG